MRSLTVLYDRNCAFCDRCAQWLKAQEKYLSLDLVPLDSGRGRAFAQQVEAVKPGELLAIDDEGGVYEGNQAYVICLYALRDYREWSARLVSPAVWPLARRAMEWLTRNRKNLSDFMKVVTPLRIDKSTGRGGIEAESPPAKPPEELYWGTATRAMTRAGRDLVNAQRSNVHG